MTRTWIRFVTIQGSRTEERVRAALAPLTFGPKHGPHEAWDVGLIVFDSVSAEVLDLVRRASRGGARILAIPTSEDALDDLGPWPLLEAGAYDVVTLANADDLSLEVEARLSRWEEVDALMRSPLVQEALVGTTPEWISLLREIVEVARFGDDSLLLLGEAGTGKDAVARLVHALDPRPFKGQLETLDCRALDPALAGAELYGYESQAFEGGDTQLRAAVEPGVLGAADGGTLLLNEASQLPEGFRAGVLRAVEEGVYRPVGATHWRETRFRLICSETEGRSVPSSSASAGPGSSAEGFCRRISGRRFRLPPLREHREDIPRIAEHLLRRHRPELHDVRLDPAVSGSLLNRDYPANVHDLDRLVKAIGTRYVGSGPVTVGAIPPEERERIESPERSWQGEDLEQAVGRALDAGVSLRIIGEAAKDAAIRVALSREAGDVKRTARRLHTTSRTVASRTAASSPAGPSPEVPARGPRPVVALPESVVLASRQSRDPEGIPGTS